MNKKLTWGAVAAAGAMIAVTGTPAEALWARPSSVAATDAAGNTNGCTVSIPELVVEPFDGKPAIVFKRQVECPASANVHRVAESGSLYEVMADDSLREIAGPGAMGSSANSGEPITGPTWAANVLFCSDPAVKGTHTYLVKGRVNTKQTPNTSDPNPFVGRVGRIQTVTCP